MRSRISRFVIVLALTPAVWACGREETEVDTQPGAEITADAVRVTAVELGTAIDADRRVTGDGASAGFSPTDTIYASVATDGAAGGTTLTARWTYQDGQVIDESRQTIAASGPAVTEFHISKPDGFPTGSYQLEILLNGRSVERKDFEVR